jgi:hypothetical protein
MPNWVTNEINIHGEHAKVELFMERLKGVNEDDTDCSVLDFNQLIPMPDLLKHTASGGRKFKDADGNEVSHTSWYSAKGSESFTLGDDSGARPFTPEEMKELAEIGATSWYDWCINNWGTKWNACRPQSDVGYFRFDTAWAPPEHIFDAMLDLADEIGGIESISFNWQEEQGFGASWTMLRESKGNWIQDDLVSWDSPEMEEVEECNGFYILESKEEDHPKAPAGFYIDWNTDERFDTLEDAREYCKS